MSRLRLPCLLAALTLLSSIPAHAALEDCAGDPTPSNPANRIVEWKTGLGSICIELLEDQAPLTTANFLAYLEDGRMDGSLPHRLVPGFVVQGGALKVEGDTIVGVPTDPPVQNEPCTLDEDVPGSPGTQRCSQRGSVRGTLSMAKQGDPLCPSFPPNPDCVPRPDYVNTFFPREQFVNSATSQWFINLADNRENLDNQNGGFTVFAVVLGDGMDIVDEIFALPTLGDRFVTLPTPFGTPPPPFPSDAYFDLPILDRPAMSESSVGCYDPTTLAALIDFDALGEAFFDEDPVSGGVPYFVSGACGTELADPADYSPDPSQSGSCSNEDLPAQRLVQNPDGSVSLAAPVIFYQLTCSEVIQSVSDTRKASLFHTFRVEEAVDLPEPSHGAAGAAVLLGLALAARTRRRPVA